VDTEIKENTRNYWQIAAGDTNRNYTDLCLEWDVVLTGNGCMGAYPECLEKLSWVTTRKKTDLGRFCAEVKHGDVVILRQGTDQVDGIGVVVGDYEHREVFGDIDGWDLQHVRRVKWLTRKQKKFQTHTMKLGDTTQKLDINKSSEIINWMKSLNLELDKEYTAEYLRSIPPDEDLQLEIKDISTRLFDQGIADYSIQALVEELSGFVRIAEWYAKIQYWEANKGPSEYETLTYLVVPLLKVLGWTPQRMAIEWNNIDIALFDQLPREDNNLNVVVEVKKKGNSCLTAVRQAESYAANKKKCNRLIVTDGLRYGVYIKSEQEFKLYAYLNIRNLKSGYPIFNCKGAAEALQAMTPEGVRLG